MTNTTNNIIELSSWISEDLFTMIDHPMWVKDWIYTEELKIMAKKSHYDNSCNILASNFYNMASLGGKAYINNMKEFFSSSMNHDISTLWCTYSKKAYITNQEIVNKSLDHGLDFLYKVANYIGVNGKNYTDEQWNQMYVLLCDLERLTWWKEWIDSESLKVAVNKESVLLRYTDETPKAYLHAEFSTFPLVHDNALHKKHLIEQSPILRELKIYEGYSVDYKVTTEIKKSQLNLEWPRKIDLKPEANELRSKLAQWKTNALNKTYRGW